MTTSAELVGDLAPDRPGEVLTALRAVSDALRAEGDARAIFPDVYAVITEGVVDGLAAGLFTQPAFISRLAGRFARRYLQTLSWSLSGLPQDCTAWSAAYGQVGRAGVAAIQHAGLGISAHVNFDLALGTAEVVEELAPARDAALLRAFKRDYDAVNRVLKTATPRVMSLLAERYGCPVAPVFTGVAGWPARTQALATVVQWRELVWRNTLDLLGASDPAARQAVVDRLELNSRVAALFITGPPVVAPAVDLTRRLARTIPPVPAGLARRVIRTIGA
ncbi:DUF5995 family protein [Planomonospora alba]